MIKEKYYTKSETNQVNILLDKLHNSTSESCEKNIMSKLDDIVATSSTRKNRIREGNVTDEDIFMGFTAENFPHLVINKV